MYNDTNEMWLTKRGGSSRPLKPPGYGPVQVHDILLPLTYVFMIIISAVLILLETTQRIVILATWSVYLNSFTSNDRHNNLLATFTLS